jgi:radical SAM superfamily enzyme YgiQ (UPF0313 family)
MRVLLINSNFERSPWPVAPVGACGVATAAQEAGHDVRFLDLCFEARPETAVARTVQDFRPEVIGVTVRNIDNVDWQHPVFYLPEVKRKVIDVCRAHAACPLVIGGPAAGIMPEELLDYFGADYLIRGDGEEAFVQLLAALSGREPLRDVPGLTYRSGGTVIVGEPARVADLDALPLPQPQRWLDLGRYFAYNGSLGVQTKRGCALQCTYCVYNRIEGACYRLRSPRRVVGEVEAAVRQGRATAIEFVDSTFNIPLDHALGVCAALAERRFPATFSTMGINPGAVTEALFRRLREANFSEVSITPETASPGMLRSLGKNFTLDDIARAARLARRAQLPIVWYFMFGAPGENAATVQETLAFIARHIPADHLVLMVAGIRIFKGAPLEAQARAEGQLLAEDSLLRPVWYQPAIPREELGKLLDAALRRHPNCIALQDNHVPGPLLRAASGLHRLLGSKRPLWQYLRHIRRLLNALGLPQHLLAHS